MASAKFKTVDAYIAAQPKPAQKVLTRVRAIIRKAVPAAEESISYNMPTYKLEAGPVLYFAGWKRHFSLYPLGAEATKVLARELSAYEVEKGTVRFPLDEPVPEKLIAAIAKLRAKETAKAKAT